MTMTETMIADWAIAAAPPPAMSISEWADAKRRLPKKSAARGARWHTSTVPYLRDIMNVFLEPGVKKIAVMKGAQVAGTEAIGNVIAYHMEYDPCAMLYVYPTTLLAEAWSKNRLDDMIHDTPELRAIVNENRSTLLHKDFDNGYLALGGANTPNSFASHSVRLAFGDDVDRFPPVVGDEGDPAELLANRTQSFFDGITAFFSTPVLKDGRIDTLFRRGDQRRFFLTCPRCGHQDWVTWSDGAHFRIGFDDRDARTARLECPIGTGCGAHLSESERRQMVRDGEWMSTAIAQEDGLVSFHLPGTLSTLGDVTLSSLVGKWLAARQGGQESLKVFINTQLGEPWEAKGTRMDPHALMNRREPYGAEGVEIPAWAVALTAGVDVQNDRLELMVQAWGQAGERAVIDYRRIPGELKRAETREQLLDALSRKYLHACGIDLPIHAVCIDSGYQTDEVYSFVLAHQARRIYATKGVGRRVGEPIVGKPSEKRTGKNGRPVALYPVNTDDAKSDVMSSMQQVTPGPNCMHFPNNVDTIDEEFFAQMCAEHRQKVYNKHKVATHEEWVKDRDRNEALDAAVLCLAAFKLLNPNVRQMLAKLQTETDRRGGAPANDAPEPAATKTTPAAPARRVIRSPYLDR